MSDDERPDKPEYSKSRKDKLLAGKYAAEARDRAAQEERDELTERVGQLEQVVQRLMRSTRPEPPQPIVWNELPTEEHAELWAELLSWLRCVLVTRFPADALAMLSPQKPHNPCWFLHPTVVEALTVGWQTHVAAWSPGADPAQRAQWLGMWRPNMREQVRSELAGCRSSGHGHQYGPADSVIDAAELGGETA